MRILLIDDSSAYMEEFRDLLSRCGVSIAAFEWAPDAEEGSRLLQAGLYHCAFVDYRLPPENGLALIQAARAAGVTRPCILLTGYGSPEIDAAAERAGANDYLPKGEFTPAMLGRAIRYGRRNAEALAAAEDAQMRLSLAHDAAGIGSWEWDLRTNDCKWSAANLALFGLDPHGTAPVPWDTWRARVHEADRAMTEAAVARTLAGAGRYDSTYRILCPDPAAPDGPPMQKWIRSMGEPVRDATGAPTRMVGVSLDVTAQQNMLLTLKERTADATAALDLSEERFRTYFEHSGNCLLHMRVEPDGGFRYVAANPTAVGVTGMLPSELYGKTPIDVLGPENGAIMIHALQQVIETGRRYDCTPAFTYNGRTIVYDAVYMPLRNAAGDIVGILGDARDITERRQLEAALQQAQKMEALGQLAGGVAHDFNNLLTGALGCFQLLKKHVASAAGRELIEEGHKVVTRGTSLTQRLLAFSRQQPLSTAALDINPTILGLQQMLARTLGPSIRLQFDAAPDAWHADTDRNQLEIAILNLAINARDAMPAGGVLRLSTGNETLEDPADLAAGDYVVVTVTDTGTGMTPQVLERALDPFFTTKDEGKGTGLGLSMVYGLARQSGGGLRIASTVGKGTAISLYLPRAIPPSAASPALGRSGTAPARLLLLDDDPTTQAAVAAYAAENGHQVVPAATWREAQAALQSGPPIEAIIVDASIAAELDATGAAVWPPALPLLRISASTDPARQPGPDETPILAKPFDQAAFEAALAALLPGRAHAGNIVALTRRAK